MGDDAFLRYSASMHSRSKGAGPPETDKDIEAGLKQAAGLLRSGRAGPAIELLLRLNRDHSGHEEVLRMAGMTLSRLGRQSEALAMFRERQQLMPESLAARSDLANVLLQSGNAVEALSLLEYRQPDHDGPTSLAYWFNLGRAYKTLGRAEEAVVPLQRVLSQQAGHFGALITLGDTYKALGRFDDAAALMRRAISVQPASGIAWWSLSNLKSGGYSEEEFAELQGRAKAGVSAAEQVYFEFALAKAFEDRGLYDEAFSHYAAGNKLKHTQESWNAGQFRQWLGTLREAFDAVELPPKPERHSESRPVFIVSLPRSGSTLTEQILAAHSQVTAASELPWLPHIIAGESRRTRSSITHWGPRAGQDDWDRLGQAYLDASRHWHQSTPVFTDKLPGNFPYVGAILRMLPDALVINVRRQPMDVCWSCYRQLFVRGSEFAYDFEDLASYWHDHDAYMRYWRERAPERVLSLDYESLVQDTEVEIRKLLDFLDLPFEKNCLQFHKAERAVNTASAAQVRQAINSSGIAHWRRYKNRLGDLQAALEKYSA